MNKLKAKRLVSFKGYTWGTNETEHSRLLAVSKKLESSKFAQYVESTTLLKDDEGKLTSGSYYDCESLLVSDKEYEELRRIGVKDLTVKGIYQDGIGQNFQIAFYSGVAAFWLWTGATLAKYLGAF